MSALTTFRTRVADIISPPAAVRTAPDVWNDYLRGAVDGGRGGGRNWATRYAPLWRAVNIIASSGARLLTRHLSVVNADGDYVEDEYARAALDVVAGRTLRPNRVGATEFWEDVFADYLLAGNAFVVCRRDRLGRPQSIIQLTADNTSTRFSAEHDHIFYEGADAAAPMKKLRTYMSKDVAHYRWPRMLGWQEQTARWQFSVSPISHLSRPIRIGLAAEGCIDDHFESGGAVGPRTYVTVEDRLNEKSRVEFINRLIKHVKERLPLVFFGRTDVGQIDDPAQDSNLLSLRQHQIAEIGRLYGIAPTLLGGDDSHVWGNGVEQLSIAFWRFGLSAHLARLLSPLSAVMLRKGEQFKVDETAFLSGDMQSISQWLDAALGRGAAITINEAREKLGLKPIDGGDQLLGPAPGAPGMPAMPGMPSGEPKPEKPKKPKPKEGGEGKDDKPKPKPKKKES